MANIKFSAFTTETDDTQIDFLAGYQGTTMKKIAPANLSGSYPFLISGSSLYSGSLAPSIVGTPISNTTLSQNNMAFTTGIRNTFMGSTCGYSTTVGEQNVAMGHNALRNAEEASNNIAIGAGALQNLNPPLTGSAFDTFNIAIGFNAGNDITEGSNNVIVGGNAADVLTTGTRNTAIGHNALSSETTGGYNVAVGLNALQDLVNGTNAYNTAVGASSLKDCTTGTQNTAIGAQTADTLLTGDNNTLLGYNAEPSSSSVSDEITLGDANVNSLRIPGLQSGASDGDVLTFSSGTGNITLQAGGGTDSFVLNFSANHASNSATNYYMFRNKSNSTMATFTTSATEAPDFYYVSLVMPAACYLKTVHIKNIQTTPSATVAKMKIWKNDTTAEFTGSNVSWTGAGAIGASWTQTLTSGDNTFAAGDRVDIGFNLDGTMGGVTCTMLFELL